MTRDEIVTSLRCGAEPGRDCEEECPWKTWRADNG